MRHEVSPYSSLQLQHTENLRHKVSPKCFPSSKDKQMHLPEAKNNANLYPYLIVRNRQRRLRLKATLCVGLQNWACIDSYYVYRRLSRDVIAAMLVDDNKRSLQVKL